MATVHLVEARGGWALGTDEQRDGPPALGDWLRQAREARGLTLDRITQETRIPRRHLEAIERGDLSVLPQFYQRAEVRAFARVVGVDEQLALARLESTVTPVQPRAAGGRPQPVQPIRRFSILYGAVALVAAAIMVAALVGRTMFDRASATAAAAPPEADSTPPSLAALKSSPTPSERDARDVSIPAPADPALAPAPASAPALTSTVTELVITTQPPGARVTVNGIGWGSSPVAIKHLPPGDKRIRVSKDGYRAVERVLVLEDGVRRSVDIPLATAP